MATSAEDKLYIEGDNYKQTVLALKALANEVFFDDASHQPHVYGTIHSGRRMTTSVRNRHSPSTDVTPDLCIQWQNSWRVLAEAKLGFGPNPTEFSRRVNETVEQLGKYDDELTGWPTTNGGKVPQSPHDLVLLVNYEDSKKVIRELLSRAKQGTFKVERDHFAVISVNRSERSSATGIWPVLELEHGSLSNPKKTEKLRDRILIHPEKLAQSIVVGRIEICDCGPPLPLMMLHVHNAIIQNLTREEREIYLLDGEVQKTVTTAEVCQLLAPLCFPKCDARDPAMPEATWVLEALRNLAAMEWAEELPDTPGVFNYIHRKNRKGYNDPYRRFIEYRAKATEQAKQREAKKEAREKERERKRKEKEAQRRSKELAKEQQKMPLFGDSLEKLPLPPRKPCRKSIPNVRPTDEAKDAGNG